MTWVRWKCKIHTYLHTYIRSYICAQFDKTFKCTILNFKFNFLNFALDLLILSIVKLMQNFYYTHKEQHKEYNSVQKIINDTKTKNNSAMTIKQSIKC